MIAQTFTFVRLAIAIAPFLPMTAFAQRYQPLVSELNDPSLAQILSSLILRKEFNLDSGLSAKIFSVDQGVECDPGREAETCPTTKLYLITGMRLESTSHPKLFITKALIGLKIKDTTIVTDRNLGTQDAIEIQVEACARDSSAEVATGASDLARWKMGTFAISVTLTGQVNASQFRYSKSYCDLY